MPLYIAIDKKNEHVWRAVPVGSEHEKKHFRRDMDNFEKQNGYRLALVIVEKGECRIAEGAAA
jgi:hypothetical protein